MTNCPSKSGTHQCERQGEHVEHAAITGLIPGTGKVRVMHWGTPVGERFTRVSVVR